MAWQVERLTPLEKMFVKMLTHVHKVVYTWWCWHIYRGGGVPRVERGVGFSLPFEKNKCIFSIALEGNLKKSQECFSEKHSPDAGVGSIGRWSRASGVLSVAQVCTGRTGVSPVLSVWCAGGLATLSVHGFGEHQTLRVRPVACVR